MSVASFLKLFAGSAAQVVKHPHDAQFSEVLDAFQRLCPERWDAALEEADANGELEPQVDAFTCVRGSFRPLEAATASLIQSLPVVARRFDGAYVQLTRIEGAGSAALLTTKDGAGFEKTYSHAAFLRDFTDVALVRARPGAITSMPGLAVR